MQVWRSQVDGCKSVMTGCDATALLDLLEAGIARISQRVARMRDQRNCTRVVMTGSATSGSRNVMPTSRGGLRCVLSPVVDGVVLMARREDGCRSMSPFAIAQECRSVYLHVRVCSSMHLFVGETADAPPAFPLPSFRGKVAHPTRLQPGNIQPQ